MKQTKRVANETDIRVFTSNKHAPAYFHLTLFLVQCVYKKRKIAMLEIKLDEFIVGNFHFN